MTVIDGIRALITSSSDRLCFSSSSSVRIVTPLSFRIPEDATSVLGAGCAEHAQTSTAPNAPATRLTEPAIVTSAASSPGKGGLPLPLGLQPVSRLPHRQDVPRHRGIALQLAPQIGDVRVERAAHDVRLVAPHFLEQLDPRRRCALASNERQQQLHLQRRQLYRRPRAPYLARRGVHLDVAKTIGHPEGLRTVPARPPRARPLDESIHTRQQLRRPDRPYGVLVGA